MSDPLRRLPSASRLVNLTKKNACTCVSTYLSEITSPRGINDPYGFRCLVNICIGRAIKRRELVSMRRVSKNISPLCKRRQWHHDESYAWRLSKFHPSRSSRRKKDKFTGASIELSTTIKIKCIRARKKPKQFQRLDSCGTLIIRKIKVRTLRGELYCFTISLLIGKLNKFLRQANSRLSLLQDESV